MTDKLEPMLVVQFSEQYAQDVRLATLLLRQAAVQFAIISASGSIGEAIDRKTCEPFRSNLKLTARRFLLRHRVDQDDDFEIWCEFNFATGSVDISWEGERELARFVSGARIAEVRA